jgi:hypothetical protein
MAMFKLQIHIVYSHKHAQVVGCLLCANKLVDIKSKADSFLTLYVQMTCRI